MSKLSARSEMRMSLAIMGLCGVAVILLLIFGTLREDWWMLIILVGLGAMMYNLYVKARKTGEDLRSYSNSHGSNSSRKRSSSSHRSSGSRSSSSHRSSGHRSSGSHSSGGHRSSGAHGSSH